MFAPTRKAISEELEVILKSSPVGFDEFLGLVLCHSLRFFN